MSLDSFLAKTCIGCLEECCVNVNTEKCKCHLVCTRCKSLKSVWFKDGKCVVCEKMSED